LAISCSPNLHSALAVNEQRALRQEIAAIDDGTGFEKESQLCSWNLIAGVVRNNRLIATPFGRAEGGPTRPKTKTARVIDVLFVTFPAPINTATMASTTENFEPQNAHHQHQTIEGMDTVRDYEIAHANSDEKLTEAEKQMRDEELSFYSNSENEYGDDNIWGLLSGVGGNIYEW